MSDGAGKVLDHELEDWFNLLLGIAGIVCKSCVLDLLAIAW